MRKIVFSTVIIGIISFFVFSLVEAKRGPAPNVRPVVYKGVKFIVRNRAEKMGYVEGWDIETNKKIWEKKVYNVIINPMMEADVQCVFISSLNLKNGKLVIINEKGRKYNIDIPKNILKAIENDTYYYLQPWDSKAPYPYWDITLINNAYYKETWVESSVERHPDAVQKAKEVLREWGQNSDKYKYNGKSYDYRISVSESQNFISIVFAPIGLEGLERHIEVRMTKHDFVVLSILPGA